MEESEHRAIGIATYNYCWKLLETPRRARDEDLELLTSAFASRYHWSFTGGPQQWVIGDWMISRAAAAIKEGSLSATFAHRANDAAQEFEAPDWLLASCAEGLARAYAAHGNARERDGWYAVAEQLVAHIADEESRELVADQLLSVPRC